MNPGSPMAVSLSSLSSAGASRLGTWLRRTNLAGRLALLLAAAATASALATYAVISGSPPYGPGVRTVVVLLNLDLILLLLLGAVVARRLVQLVVARRQGSAGSHLHVRLVALFSVVAVAPAIVVAVFSVVFLNVGLEAWFSERVRDALTNSLAVARSYLDEHREVIRADALAMAADLNREGPVLLEEPRVFQRLVETQAALRSLTEAVVAQSNGRVLARTGLSFGLELEGIPPSVIERAADGELLVLTSDADDRVRALLRLDNFIDTYLLVGRFIDPRVLNAMHRTQRVVDEYHQMESRRSGIQVTFALIFGIVALLLLLAAVWVGLSFANQLATPISRLIAAADRVRAGDLTARVPEGADRDEVASLSRAFNRMTNQLGSQRQELVEANRQLDLRRRFTEAVFAGVSAGIIGLDAEGRITLINRAAAGFLGADPGDLTGRPVGAVMPEAAGLLTEVGARPGEETVQRQLDVVRDERTRTLLMRASAQTGGADGATTTTTGYVLTFDDISELLAAQRKAAWAEIARRIAHEVKNPLTPIRLSAERLRRKYLKQIETDPEAFVACTDMIERQVDSIQRLIDEFSAFARMPAPVFRRESAAELARQAVQVQQVARPEIAFDTRLPEAPIDLYCDGRQVVQALTNLLQNAVEAILAAPPEPAAAEGGRPRGRVVVRPFAVGGRAGFEVEDDGRGLPEGNLERLSLPYVTTRADGTGLGLAIVKKIMEEHGGALELRRRREGGACVRLVFPAPSPPARVAAAVAATG
ncbi:MAG TPA: PAS domain-containing sensor histidine kinase [Geminicoccaceae bacterium]|nr:PAS domain-containing sensor histidine kinase [Geminicoccaceae bacterium]